jgi:hypothetical protein
VVSSHAEIRTVSELESLTTIIDPISDRPFRADFVLKQIPKQIPNFQV